MDKKEYSTLRKWSSIKTKIECEIINGKYKEMAKFPSIKQTAKIYDCGTTTAQKVLEKLVNEDVLYKKQAYGYYVMPDAVILLKHKHLDEIRWELNKVIDLSISFNVSQDDLKVLIDETMKNKYPVN